MLCNVFTALHVMQTRYSDENSVRPSVCPSDDLERRDSLYFAFFHRIRQIFRPIISQWLKIEDRPIISVKYCLPVPVFYF